MTHVDMVWSCIFFIVFAPIAYGLFIAIPLEFLYMWRKIPYNIRIWYDDERKSYIIGHYGYFLSLSYWSPYSVDSTGTLDKARVIAARIMLRDHITSQEDRQKKKDLRKSSSLSYNRFMKDYVIKKN